MNSFFKNEILPKENMQFINIEKELDLCKAYIYEVQSKSNKYGDCYLSFYPLAKNIRFISSYFFKNIRMGLKPRISLNCRPGEDYFWTSKTKDNWYPWLWGRYFEKKSNNKESWENIFSTIDKAITIQNNQENFVDFNNINDFVLYLSCLDFIFELNEKFLETITQTIINKYIPQNNLCGLQIRRGEIVAKDGDLSKSYLKARPIYTIDDYMIGVKKVCEKLNNNDVFVSTDSNETINYLKENYPDYKFYDNLYDKNNFLRYSESNLNKYNLDGPSLEFDINLRQDLIKFYTETCISDLYLLSKCKGYVGGMTYSEFGICGWFLQMAKQKSINPYYNVEGEFNLKGDKTSLLLL